MALLYVATAAFRLEEHNVQGETLKTALFIPCRTDNRGSKGEAQAIVATMRWHVCALRNQGNASEKEDWNFSKTAPNQAVLPV